jgi:VWFA-related protein
VPERNHVFAWGRVPPEVFKLAGKTSERRKARPRDGGDPVQVVSRGRGISKVNVSIPSLLALLTVLTMPCHAQTPVKQEDPVPTLRVRVARVLVPVLALDKAGNPVDGLTKDDFQVIDEGKQHSISALTVLRDESVRSGAPEKEPARTDGHDSTQKRPQRFVVFLIDDLHMDIRDLIYVKKAASAVLSSSLDPLDYAGLISMSTKTYTQLTRDRAKLLQGFDSVQIRNVFQQSGMDCPNISYYQAVQIDRDRSAESTAFQAAMANAAVCFPNLSQGQLEAIVREAVRRVSNVGDQDALSSYATIASAIQAVSVLPGERRLILVSPGFEGLEQDALRAESSVIDLALASNVTISALDARGVYVANIGADERGSVSFRHNANVVQQDLRITSLSNASGTMASLAYGTGGTFFHNNNDLGKGFRNLTQIPKIEYFLELSSEGLKADGRYHSLSVKVRRKGVVLIARRGYVVPKPEKSKKPKN